jgi:hypothetical protein
MRPFETAHKLNRTTHPKALASTNLPKSERVEAPEWYAHRLTACCQMPLRGRNGNRIGTKRGSSPRVLVSIHHTLKINRFVTFFDTVELKNDQTCPSVSIAR